MAQRFNVDIKTTAKKLNDMGLAVIWLRPNSKAPIESGWQNKARKETPQLLKEFSEGNNVGLKMGRHSKIKSGGKTYYLAAVDVDVKSKNIEDTKKAVKWVQKNFKLNKENTVVTMSGRGGGSCHVWFKTKKPASSLKLFTSPKKVEVFMPSAKPTRPQIEKLGAKKIKEGWRIRPAFEIDLLGEGRQIVLPPSIHPDTGRRYKFAKEWEKLDEIKYVNISKILNQIEIKRPSSTDTIDKSYKDSAKGINGIKIKTPSHIRLELDLGEYWPMLCDGEDVDDRSAALMKISGKMFKCGYSMGEVLGALTDRDLNLGHVAYEHAQSNKRQRAALWLYRYGIKKSQKQNDPSILLDEPIEEIKISKKEVKKNEKEDRESTSWKQELDRDSNDKLRPTLKNVIAILQNKSCKDIFKRDTFGIKDIVTNKNPWGSKAGEHLTDDDALKIKIYLSKKWKIEPNVNLIHEAMSIIAIQNSFNSIQEEIKALEWDGKHRIDTWLQVYLDAKGPSEYLKIIGRKWLCAMVARSFNPGIKFDHMLVLEGEQGKGKSTVGEILAGDEKRFSDELPDLKNKDSALKLNGIWVHEFSELANFRRNEIETIKAFVSRRIDDVRPPYGRRNLQLKRSCVFIGSTNNDSWHTDDSGGRRFWPVKVGNIKLKKSTQLILR